MFTGLSAFPLTPVTADGIDERGFIRLLERLTEAEVDSIGVLGSTGSYAYLTLEQRKKVTALACSHASHIPVLACVGAMNTDDVLQLAEDAQMAGASALLMPVLRYQPLRDDEVFGLFETLTQNSDLPVCIYDNPRTTGSTFSDDLLVSLSKLTGIASIKIPGLGISTQQLTARIEHLRQLLPTSMTIGISGDERGVAGLQAGCDLWYSALGGLFPRVAKQLTAAAASGDATCGASLEPVWELFCRYGGSVRVLAAAAGILGITQIDCLPRPLRPLASDEIESVAKIITRLGLV